MPFKQAHLHFKRRAPQAVEPRLPYRLHLIILRRFGKGLHLRLRIALGVPRVDAHSVAFARHGRKIGGRHANQRIGGKKMVGMEIEHHGTGS